MKNRRAFTLIELVMSMALGVILVLAMGMVLLDSQNTWASTYGKVNGDVSVDSRVTVAVFDSIVRKSSMDRYEIGPNGEYAEVYYYSSESATMPDQYALFYVTDETLYVAHGPLVSGTYATQKPTTTLTLAEGVTSVNLSKTGASIEMIVKFSDDSESSVIMRAAVRQRH